MFSLIAAIGKNRELGKGGELIFHIKEDMKFFRETTSGHKIVMGRKTWESLPGKLPNRTNIVISSRDFEGPDEIIHNLDDFIAKNKDTEEEVFVIGGGKIYAEFLPVAKKLYLTEVNAENQEADTYFPEFDKNQYTKQLIKEGKDDDLAFAISLYQLN
ncbi:dihydrofolate reductase [Candidatus Saccharibacteria bacterium]|nr:dihydrofolate reductase [Candidatus Saccharibacteria bacterium]